MERVRGDWPRKGLPVLSGPVGEGKARVRTWHGAHRTGGMWGRVGTCASLAWGSTLPPVAPRCTGLGQEWVVTLLAGGVSPCSVLFHCLGVSSAWFSRASRVRVFAL